MGQLCSLPPQDRAKIWCELAYVLFMSVSPWQLPPSSTLYLTHKHLKLVSETDVGAQLTSWWTSVGKARKP